MTRKAMALLMVVLSLFAAGCWDLRVIEDLSLVLALGIDQDESNPGMLIVTAAGPAFSQEASEPTFRTTTMGYCLTQAFMSMQLERQRELAFGEMDVVVFSEEAARSGNMHRVMRDLDQVRDLDPNAWVCIVRKARAQHVLNLVPREESRAFMYLTTLLERNSNIGSIPRATVARYSIQHSAQGIDPIIPVIELIGAGDKPEDARIVGLAAIDSRGKMVGTLTDSETKTFLLLAGLGNRPRFSTHIDYQGQSGCAVSGLVRKTKREVRAGISRGRPVIDVRIRLEVDILNLQAGLDNVLEEKVFRTLEKALARDFQGNMLKVLRKTQDWGADILGLGRFVRAQDPDWYKDKDWSEEYRDCQVNVQVEVKVQRIGTLVSPLY